MTRRKGGRSRTASKKANPVKRREATPPSSPSKFAGKKFFDPKAAAAGDGGEVEVQHRLRGVGLLDREMVTRIPDQEPAPHPGFVAVEGAVYERHRGQFCPGCDRPAQVKVHGWPHPCRVRVSSFVCCGDTEAATESAQRGKPAHHYNCTFWDHHPDAIPF